MRVESPFGKKVSEAMRSENIRILLIPGLFEILAELTDQELMESAVLLKINPQQMRHELEQSIARVWTGHGCDNRLVHAE